MLFKKGENMKKLKFYFIILLLTLFFSSFSLTDIKVNATTNGTWLDDITVATNTWDNGGTIKNVNEFVQFAYNVTSGKTYNGKTIKLGADIDLSGKSWISMEHFYGTFDGKYHTISGMTIDNDSLAGSTIGTNRYLGLFGRLSGATIKNLTLEGSMDITINDTSRIDINVGSLYGTGSNLIIENVTVNVPIEADLRSWSSETGINIGVGGFAGFTTISGTNKSLIKNCASLGNVTVKLKGSGYVGGFIQSAVSTDVINCYALGDVTVTDDNLYNEYVGGFAPSASSTNSWTNCYYGGTVTSNTNYYDQMWGSRGSLTAENVYAKTGCISKYRNFSNNTYTSVGTFTNNTGVLTATESTTLSYGADLLTALNAYVSANSEDGLYAWNVNPAINNGYPYLIVNVPTPVTYTVTFDIDGGSSLDDQTIEENDFVSKPTNDPTKTGYTFGGYYKDSGFVMEWNFTTEAVTTDTTIYVKWIEIIPTYTVTFDIDGGSSLDDQTIDRNGLVTKPTNDPTKTGYTFGGYYKDSGFTEEWNFPTDTVTTDTTIYVKWVEVIPTYTVTFDIDGGSSLGNLTIDDNGLVTKPTNDPTKTGYTFGGYYKDSGFTEEWNFTTDTVTSNTTIYVKWVANGSNIGLIILIVLLCFLFLLLLIYILWKESVIKGKLVNTLIRWMDPVMVKVCGLFCKKEKLFTVIGTKTEQKEDKVKKSDKE